MVRELANRGFESSIRISNGVDVPVKISSRHKLAIWVGRLSEEKGIRHVLPGLVTLPPDWKIVVVGEGPAKRDLMKLYPRVSFVGFKDPAPYYRRASLSVMSSICYENQPYVILESMSYGIPVVGSRIGGIPELLRKPSTGITYEPGSAESFANALGKLANSPNLILKLGGAGRKKIARDYVWTKTLRHYLETYR
jgi:glycosyltransferase involved in cell wall biosynthesis